MEFPWDANEKKFVDVDKRGAIRSFGLSQVHDALLPHRLCRIEDRREITGITTAAVTLTLPDGNYEVVWGTPRLVANLGTGELWLDVSLRAE